MSVAILMGSDSDWSVMESCYKELKTFGVETSVKVCSAHRSPEDLHDYIKNSEAKVFIAAAGMSAALAGTIAAVTTKPVIGVPIESGAMQGMDALLSTVQMPPGVPVACVAVNGAKNAAILAVQILSLQSAPLKAHLEDRKVGMRDVVRDKDVALQTKIT